MYKHLPGIDSDVSCYVILVISQKTGQSVQNCHFGGHFGKGDESHVTEFPPNKTITFQWKLSRLGQVKLKIE